MREAVIVSAVRTPIGKYGGALAGVRPDDMAALVIRSALERVDIPGKEVEDVYFGAANQVGEDNRNVARMALLLAGLPMEIPGVTVNRLCASGLTAINLAVKSIIVEEGDIYVAGGVESMSRAPFVMAKPEIGFPRGDQTIYDSTLGWRFINPDFAGRYGIESLGETAENVAEEFGVSREEQDAFALESHRRAAAAQDGGRFDAEIVPLETTDPKREMRLVTQDEGIRRDTSLVLCQSCNDG